MVDDSDPEWWLVRRYFEEDDEEEEGYVPSDHLKVVRPRAINVCPELYTRRLLFSSTWNVHHGRPRLCHHSRLKPRLR